MQDFKHMKKWASVVLVSLVSLFLLVACAPSNDGRCGGGIFGIGRANCDGQSATSAQAASSGGVLAPVAGSGGNSGSGTGSGSGGSAGNGGSGGSVSGGGEPQLAPVDMTFRAKRYYNPARHEDASLTLPRAISMIVPATLTLESGDTRNVVAKLSIDGLVCDYHRCPVAAAEDRTLAFEGCTSAQGTAVSLRAGDEISVASGGTLTLRVNTGDSRAGVTVVSVTVHAR